MSFCSNLNDGDWEQAWKGKKMVQEQTSGVDKSFIK